MEAPLAGVVEDLGCIHLGEGGSSGNDEAATPPLVSDSLVEAATPPLASDSLVEAALKVSLPLQLTLQPKPLNPPPPHLKVLTQPDPWKKAEFTNLAVALWRQGLIGQVCPASASHLRVPDRPSRADDKVLLPFANHWAGPTINA